MKLATEETVPRAAPSMPDRSIECRHNRRCTGFDLTDLIGSRRYLRRVLDEEGPRSGGCGAEADQDLPCLGACRSKRFSRESTHGQEVEKEEESL